MYYGNHKFMMSKAGKKIKNSIKIYMSMNYSVNY